MSALLDALRAVVADATPVLIAVIGAVVGLVLLVVLGRWIVSRVKGGVTMSDAEFNRQLDDYDDWRGGW